MPYLDTLLVVELTMDTTLFADFISLGLIRDVELLAGKNNCVLWIRDTKYQQQLYLSSTYASLWERDCLSLYLHPETWIDTLDIAEAETFIEKLKTNRIELMHKYTTIYCIKTASGIKWFQDRSFQLTLSINNEKLIAGCALYIPDKETMLKENAEIDDRLDDIITNYHRILIHGLMKQEKTVPLNNTTILETLSNREIEVFKLLLRGYTMIQAAEAIHLSPRTIEGYLVSLKNKLSCNSKSELIMKALENNWFTINI